MATSEGLVVLNDKLAVTREIKMDRNPGRLSAWPTSDLIVAQSQGGFSIINVATGAIRKIEGQDLQGQIIDKKINIKNGFQDCVLAPDAKSIYGQGSGALIHMSIDSVGGVKIIETKSVKGYRIGHISISSDSKWIATLSAPDGFDNFAKTVPTAFIYKTQSLDEPVAKIEIHGVREAIFDVKNELIYLLSIEKCKIDIYSFTGESKGTIPFPSTFSAEKIFVDPERKKMLLVGKALPYCAELP